MVRRGRRDRPRTEPALSGHSRERGKCRPAVPPSGTGLPQGSRLFLCQVDGGLALAALPVGLARTRHLRSARKAKTWRLTGYSQQADFQRQCGTIPRNIPTRIRRCRQVARFHHGLPEIARGLGRGCPSSQPKYNNAIGTGWRGAHECPPPPSASYRKVDPVFC